MRGALAFVRYLEAEGIRYLFGNPGTTEVGIMDALVDSSLEYILCLQENAAVGAADGLSQATGRASVVNLHTGPGLAQGFSNLYMASRHRAPVVVTAGNEYTDFAMTEPLLQANLVRMAEPLVKWSVEPKTPEQLIPSMRRAFKVAQTPPRGPVFVSIPLDLQMADVGDPDMTKASVPAGPAPDPNAVRKAVELVSEASDPCIIAGDDVGRTRSAEALVRVAEKTGARVFNAPLALFQSFPNRHPLFAGGLPAFPSIIANLLKRHDVVVAIGAPVFYLYYYQPDRPLPETSNLIHVHPDGWELDKNFNSEVACISTADRFLAAFEAEWDELPFDNRERATARAKNAREEIAGQRRERRSETPSEGPVTPQTVVAAMAEVAGENLAVVDESVTSSGAPRQGIDLRDEESFFGHKGGALGWGAGAALGVALGLPTRRIVATIGDGSMMYAPQALWSAARYRIPVTYVVLNNAGYAIIKAGTAALQGRAAQTGKFIGMDLDSPEISYVALAESMGVPATRVTSNETLPAAFEKAFSSGGPYLIDAVLGSPSPRLPV